MNKIFKLLSAHLIALLFVVFGFSPLQSQNCNITLNSEMPVCSGYTYLATVPFQENCKYEWALEGIPITSLSDTSVLVNVVNKSVTVESDTLLSITITDTITMQDCMGDLVITIHPTFTIAFDQIQLTCSNPENDNGNTASVKATAEGLYGPEEYHYFWDVKPLQVAPGDSSLVIGLAAHQNYKIDIKDPYGCIVRDTFKTKAYQNPKILISVDPDTAYIQNPYVTFQFVNLSADSISISNFNWNFGDCDCYGLPPLPECCFAAENTLEVPTHAYTEVGEYFPYVTIYNNQGCDTNYYLYNADTALQVKPVKLKAYNVITPNGDGLNDYFVIKEDDTGDEDIKSEIVGSGDPPINLYYQSSQLIIFNREGRTVYESNNYKNDWDGGDLPDGVYFFVLKCTGEVSNDVYKGSITILDSGR